MKRGAHITRFPSSSYLCIPKQNKTFAFTPKQNICRFTSLNQGLTDHMLRSHGLLQEQLNRRPVVSFNQQIPATEAHIESEGAIKQRVLKGD